MLKPIPNVISTSTEITDIISMLTALTESVSTLNTAVESLESQLTIFQEDNATCCAKTQRKLNRILRLLNSTDVDDWTVGVHYYIGDLIMYEDVEYSCLQEHVSQSDWTPSETPALWEVLIVDTSSDYSLVSNEISTSNDIVTYEIKKNILGKEKIKKVKE